MAEKFIQQELAGAALPARLKDLPDPPASVWVAGRVPRQPSVGLVGTRRPTPEGAEYAFDLARHLAQCGVAVISGGALGIDAAAHRGAIAAGGVTLVVAPAGLESPYPVENAPLFDEILRVGGGYLSLVEPGKKATLPSFFARNAALAALCEVLVMVQAPVRSGARNAAAAARRLGRSLLVVPGPPWEPAARGCIAELRLGGVAIDSPRQVLDAIEARGASPLGDAMKPSVAFKAPAGARQTRSPAVKVEALNPIPHASGAEEDRQVELFAGLASGDEASAVIAALRSGHGSVDDICATTQLPVTTVQRVLLRLELDGKVSREPHGGYSL